MALQTRTDPPHPDRTAALISALGSVPLPMFHGTRRSHALDIAASGFIPRPVTEQLRAVAEDHGLLVDEVIADLEKHYRFAIFDPRPNRVYVVGDAARAGSWADRAPEAT